MKTLPLANITPNTLLNEKLETAYLVADWYKFFLYQKQKPALAFPKLEEALQCQRILNEYIQSINLSLKRGLRLINSSLTEAQIVWTWQQIQLAKSSKGRNKRFN